MKTQNVVRRCWMLALVIGPLVGLLLAPSLDWAYGQAQRKKQTPPAKTSTKKKPAVTAPKAPTKPASPGKQPVKVEPTPAANPTAPAAPSKEPAQPEKPGEGAASETPKDQPAAPAGQGSAPAKATYMGPASCAVCHEDVHKSWQKKTHSEAFALLVARKADKTPECLKCHTTGYGRGGYVDAEKTPELKGVTCESCHGPGSEHNGDKEKITRVPPATVCTDCHMKSNIH